MENTVRVLVANRPRLLREMVLSALSEQEGIDVVGEAEDERDVPEMVARTRPDFLLIGMEEGRRRSRPCSKVKAARSSKAIPLRKGCQQVLNGDPPRRIWFRKICRGWRQRRSSSWEF